MVKIIKRIDELSSKLDAIQLRLNEHRFSSKQKEILTAKEAMSLLSINRNTFNRWREIGLIKVYSINRRLFCKYSEILESLENGLSELA